MRARWSRRTPARDTLRLRQPRLHGDQPGRAFEFFPDGVQCGCTIATPPFLRGAYLSLGEVADLDGKRPFHSRPRSSSSNSFIGVVCRRSHWAIASSSIRSVSASASNVSSSSGAKTVTAAPSGSSTRPPTTLPDAMRIAKLWQHLRGLRMFDLDPQDPHRRAKAARRVRVGGSTEIETSRAQRPPSGATDPEARRSASSRLTLTLRQPSLSYGRHASCHDPDVPHGCLRRSPRCHATSASPLCHAKGPKVTSSAVNPFDLEAASALLAEVLNEQQERQSAACRGSRARSPTGAPRTSSGAGLLGSGESTGAA